jgi:type IV pilus assembly protein PilF
MKIRCAASALLLCCVMVFLQACAQRPGAEKSSGADLVTESDEPQARRRARLRLELASGYLEQGQPAVALDEIKQALTLDPAFSEAYSLRGLVYMRLADNGLAEESFKRAIALNPRDADAAHNYAWLLCQQARYPESSKMFSQAVGNPSYAGRAKSLMADGVCLVRAGKRAEAEQSFLKSYEIDAGSPLTAYNLSSLLYERGDLSRAQFYMRRLNNSQLANSESLWLGIKIEQRLNDRAAMVQLGDQLRKRFGQTREAAWYEKGAFNE